MKVYGASVSYYTGKLETYLRCKGIAYQRESPYPVQRTIEELLLRIPFEGAVPA